MYFITLLSHELAEVEVICCTGWHCKHLYYTSIEKFAWSELIVFLKLTIKHNRHILYEQIIHLWSIHYSLPVTIKVLKFQRIVKIFQHKKIKITRFLHVSTYSSLSQWLFIATYHEVTVFIKLCICLYFWFKYFTIVACCFDIGEKFESMTYNSLQIIVFRLANLKLQNLLYGSNCMHKV